MTGLTITRPQVLALAGLTGRVHSDLALRLLPSGHLAVERDGRVWTISPEGATARLLPVRGTVQTQGAA